MGGSKFQNHDTSYKNDPESNPMVFLMRISFLPSNILKGSKYERQQKLHTHESSYATLCGNKSKIPSNNDNKAEKKS